MKNVVFTLMLLAVCGVAIADVTSQDSLVAYRASDGSWYGSESTVNSPYIQPGYPTPVTTTGAIGGANPTLGKALVGDVNGDGVDDIVMTSGATTVTFSAAHSSYNPVTSVTTFGTSQNSTTGAFGGTASAALKFRFLGDLNGDGADDAIICNEAFNWNRRYSVVGSGLSTTAAAGPVGFGVTGSTALIGDLNGDDRVDVLYALPNGTPGYMNWSGALTGNGTVGANGIIGAGGLVSNNGAAIGLSTDIPLIGDINGDGRDDIVLAENNGGGGIQWIGALTGVGGVFNGGGLTGYAQFGNWGLDTPMLADINNDGMKDIVAIGANGAGLLSWRAMFSTGTGFTGVLNASGNFGLDTDIPLVADLNSIPEPATMAILGLGSLLVMRRRKA